MPVHTGTNLDIAAVVHYQLVVELTRAAASGWQIRRLNIAAETLVQSIDLISKSDHIGLCSRHSRFQGNDPHLQLQHCHGVFAKRRVQVIDLQLEVVILVTHCVDCALDTYQAVVYGRYAGIGICQLSNQSVIIRSQVLELNIPCSHCARKRVNLLLQISQAGSNVSERRRQIVNTLIERLYDCIDLCGRIDPNLGSSQVMNVAGL